MPKPSIGKVPMKGIPQKDKNKKPGYVPAGSGKKGK